MPFSHATLERSLGVDSAVGAAARGAARRAHLWLDVVSASAAAGAHPRDRGASGRCAQRSWRASAAATTRPGTGGAAGVGRSPAADSGGAGAARAAAPGRGGG